LGVQEPAHVVLDKQVRANVVQKIKSFENQQWFTGHEKMVSPR